MFEIENGGSALFAGERKLTKSAPLSTPETEAIDVSAQLTFCASVTRERRAPPFLQLALPVRSRNPVGGLYHLAGHGHEFVQTRTWDDDRVPTTVRFLGDTHKAPSFIFAEFNIEMLTFDLKFFRDNYVIHDAWRAST